MQPVAGPPRYRCARSHPRSALLPINDDAQCAAAVADGEVTVFLCDYVTAARIGVYPSERTREQRVRIDIAVRVQNCAYPFSKHNVLDYNHLRDGVRAIIDTGLETRLIIRLAQCNDHAG